jgi:hypothetical protein
MPTPNPPASIPPDGPAAKFVASMTITHEMWHDGTGYDLDALRAISPAELPAIEAVLIDNTPRDWRDIEALAAIDSEPARAVVIAALKSGNAEVRREAMNHFPEKLPEGDRETLLLKALREKDDVFEGLGAAIDEAAEFHPPAVIDVLFKGACDRPGQIAVHFAALLFFIHGKSAEPFDWNHRPFFLRFDTSNRSDRKAVFKELCQTLGVDSKKWLPYG